MKRKQQRNKYLWAVMAYRRSEVFLVLTSRDRIEDASAKARRFLDGYVRREGGPYPHIQSIESRGTIDAF